MTATTLKELFLTLTEGQKKAVGEYYERHFTEDGGPDFLPVLTDFYQQLQAPVPQLVNGARLRIKSFSEYENEAQLLAVYQKRAAEDPAAADKKEPTYFITEAGEKLAGPLLPSLSEEIMRLENEMANDQWEKSFYPDFSYLPGGTPPDPADFTDQEKFKQAEDAYFFGYAVDFMPTDLLINLPMELSDEDRQRLSPPLIIADFLYENYFFGGENVTAVKEELLKDVKRSAAAASGMAAKYENARMLEEKLAAFLATEPQEFQEDNE